MRSLPSLVLRRTLMVGILPVILASLVTLSMILRHGVLDAIREANFEASRSKALLDHATALEQARWIEALRADFLSPESDPDHQLLSPWIDADTGVCLVSVWKGDSLEFSHPRRDEMPPGPLAKGGWSEVETHPRCAGPVVRMGFPLDTVRTALVTYRLNGLWMLLSGPLRYPGSRSSLLDRHGSVVGDRSMALQEIPESDPIISQVTGDSRGSAGWRLEPGGLVAFSSQKLSGPPWWIVVRQDVPATLAPLAPLGLVVLLTLVGAAWLAYMLARSSTVMVLEPLVQLRNSLSALEEGEYEGELVAGDIQEINQLANAYNRMAAAIQERESHRLRELETMVAELESFSYSVSHDLRTPLRSIHGFARILLEEQEGHLVGEGKDHLQRIQSAAHRMGLLIDDLLRLAHAARSPLKVESIPVDDLVNDLLSELRGSMDHRDIHWSIDPLGVCHGDPGLLRQVWSNLLSNAIKYSRKTESARIRVWQEQGPDGSWWWVQDNGIGFEPSHATKLFGVFQRLHSQSEFEGTGVGLALVKRIVERHGGKVLAEGKPDAGAKVGFSIPRLPV